MSAYRDIQSEQLVRLLSHKNTGNLNDDERGKHLQINQQYDSCLPNSQYIFDFDSYINRLKDLISQNDIGSHFDFIKLRKPEIIDENGFSYFTKYKIVIKHLRVSCIRERNFYFDCLQIDESFPECSTLVDKKYNGGIYLEFRNNVFLAGRSDYNCHVTFDIRNYNYIKFIDNKFENVDLFIGFSSVDSFVELRGNYFDSRHLTIGGGNITTHKSGEWRLNKEIAGKVLGAKRLEGFINSKDYNKKRDELLRKISKKENDISTKDILSHLINTDNKISIDAKNVEYPDKNSLIRIKNNRINEIKISGIVKYYFKGVNNIKKITSEILPSYIYLGPYQNIDKKGQHHRQHKELFIYLKERTIANKDKSQEYIFHKEILKCERAILKEEGSVSLKDRFLLLFNEKSNNYGLNWVMPICWILLINTCFCLIVTYSFGYRFDFNWNNFFNTIGVFSEFLIPTNSVSKVLDLKELNKGWEAFNIFKNIFISILAYQTITAFRKYKNN